MIFSRRLLVATASLLFAAGCSDSGPTEPEVQPVISHTVNASTDWGYVGLGSTVTPITLTDASTSTSWDLGFRATSVRVNGSPFTTAGVKVYCVCQNAIATMTPAQILAMTPDSELADFNAVTSASIPSSAAAWDVGATAEAGAFSVHPWHKYNLDGNHTISPTFNVYLVKRGDDVYKLQVIGYYGPAGETRQISFRYALL